MMDESDSRTRLEQRLSELDWRRGHAKSFLLDHVASDAPLQAVLERDLGEGPYFSSRDVLAALSAPAGRAPEVAPEQNTDTPDSEAPRVGLAPRETEQVAAGADSRRGDRGIAADPRLLADLLAKGAAQAAHRAAAEAEVAARLADRFGELPERVKQTASQARDQVFSIQTRWAEPEPTMRRGDPTRGSRFGANVPQRAIPVALSATVAGLGQAYNRQPAKAAAVFIAGATLGTTSGVTTWLVRRLSGNECLTVGAARPRPFLLGIWTVLYVVNLWDAWQGSTAARQARRSQPTATSPRTWADVIPNRQPGPGSSGDPTEELPVIPV